MTALQTALTVDDAPRSVLDGWSITASDERRFWSKVDKRPGDSCWLWTAGIDRHFGYGVFGLANAGRKHKISAHRFSYWLHFGDPGALFVLHKCDVPPCVRPQHLFTGTQAENVRDMVSKGRLADFRGASNSSATVTEDGVLAIRASAAAGERYRVIAARHGISIPAVCMIVRRQRWAHLE